MFWQSGPVFQWSLLLDPQWNRIRCRQMGGFKQLEDSFLISMMRSNHWSSSDVVLSSSKIFFYFSMTVLRYFSCSTLSSGEIVRSGDRMSYFYWGLEVQTSFCLLPNGMKWIPYVQKVISLPFRIACRLVCTLKWCWNAKLHLDLRVWTGRLLPIRQ